MLCTDTNGVLPALRIAKDDIALALRINAMRQKIKETGGVGDTEVKFRMQPDGTIKSVNYSFSEPGEKHWA
jgi:hypothetical protein